jgi:hypothetical protein
VPRLTAAGPDQPFEKSVCILRSRLAAEDLEPHGAPRAVVHDEAHPPAKRPGLV